MPRIWVALMVAKGLMLWVVPGKKLIARRYSSVRALSIVRRGGRCFGPARSCLVRFETEHQGTATSPWRKCRYRRSALDCDPTPTHQIPYANNEDSAT